MLKRLTLPRLSASEAQSRSAIAREIRDRRISVLSTDDDAAELTLAPLTEAAPSSIFSDAQWLDFEWAGARFAVELPAAAIDAWLRAMLGGVVPATLSPKWRASAIARACGPVLKALGATGQGQARLLAHGVASSAPPPAHAFALTIHYPGSGEAVHGRLHADGLGLLLAGGIASRLTPQAAAREYSAMPVTMQLSMGEAQVPIGLLRTVGAGDVVWITRRLIEADDQLLLNVPVSGGVAGVVVQASGAQLTVIDTLRYFMSDSPPRPDHGSEFHWEDLPVRLVFDVGEKMLALRELKRLQPGETLALDHPLEAFVTIRANGAVIGSGELVDIDGRLGVSVVSLNAPAQADTQHEHDPEEWGGLGEDDEA